MRKSLKLSSKISIMLMVILLNLSLSTNALTQEEEIPYNLVLDEPKLVVINKVEYVGFDTTNYETILKLYTFYQTYIDQKIMFDEMIVTYEDEIDLLNERLRLKKLTVKTLEDDRKFAYEQLEKMIEQMKKQERMEKIKIVLWTGGGVLVGTGIGILIGFLAK